MSKNGDVRLTPSQRRRWGLAGAEVSLRETAQGLLLLPTDPPLARVYIEPTTACNLSCSACVRRSWNEPEGYMDIGLYRQLADALGQVPTLRSMAFWGIGEPLLHPHIAEMVQLAHKLGAKTEIITNGLLLSRSVADALVEAGLDTLVVSIDGASAQTQAEIRSGADLRLVEQNINSLHQSRYAHRLAGPEVGIEFVVSRRNVAELPNLRRLAFSLGATFIVLSNVLPYSEEFKDDILYWLAASNLYTKPHTRWFPEIHVPRMDARQESLAPLMGLLRHSGALDLPESRSAPSTPYCRFVNEGALAVRWDGDVSPCIALMHSYNCFVLGRQKSIRRYVLGNVGREDIRSIWKREEYRQFRARVRGFEFSPCVDCGGCFMSESNEEDCFGNPFPACGDCLWAHGIIVCP